MARNKEFAKGYAKTDQAKKKANALWAEIERELNLLGPPIREIKGWKQVWAGHKDYIKNKLRNNKLSISGTGGGPSKFIPLTPSEEQVAELLQMELTLTGVPGAESFGTAQKEGSTTFAENISEPVEKLNLPYAREVEVETGEQIGEISNAPHAIPHLRRGKKAQKEHISSLLEKQIQMQSEFHENTTNNLGSIKRSLRDLSETERRKCKLYEKELNLRERNVNILENYLKKQEEYLKLITEQIAEGNRLKTNN